MENIQRTKKILEDNSTIVYGIFVAVSESNLFPTMKFLNEFLIRGTDPCDQDGIIDWLPLELNEMEYNELKKWWLSKYPNAIETDLGVGCWANWALKMLDGDDYDYNEFRHKDCDENKDKNKYCPSAIRNE